MTEQHLLRFIRSATGRLAMSYLAIIMTMSIGFSIVFYHTSARALKGPDPNFDVVKILETGQSIEAYLQERADQARQRLRNNLVFLNMIALGGGAFLSYYLARRSLEPIEQAMDAQSRFVSDASHELRTPLAAIQAENEVALRKPDLTLARAKALLASNLEEAGKLKTLSNALLQLSQTERGIEQLVPISLAEIATEAINRIIQPAQAKDITVEDAVHKSLVLADKQLLTQAVVILLDNAIKYSPSHQTIFLESRSVGKYMLLQVRDEGPGMTATDQTHIFERFYRADQSRSKQQVAGYGLGLSIAHKIMEQLGGNISVRSTPGQGAAFTLTLLKAPQQRA